jgi:hypothetical protein
VLERDSIRNRFVPTLQGRSPSKGRHLHYMDLGKSLEEEPRLRVKDHIRSESGAGTRLSF